LEVDDAVLLDTPLPAPRIDPLRLFLEADVAFVEGEDGGQASADGFALGFNGQREEGVFGGKEDEEDEEYREAAAPLVLGGRVVAGVEAPEEEEAKHSMLQQVDWEADICWDGGEGSGDDADVEEEDDEEEEPDWENAGGEVKMGLASAAVGQGKEVPPDSDDDEMEWEEGGASAAVEKTVGAAAKVPMVEAGVKKAEPPVAATAAKPPLPGKPGPAKLPSPSPVPSSVPEGANLYREKKGVAPPRTAVVIVPGGVKDPRIVRVLTPNTDLATGDWVHDIAWDSCADTESQSSDATHVDVDRLASATDRLILDMNDHNMVLEEEVDVRPSHLPPTSQQQQLQTRLVALAPADDELDPSAVQLRVVDPFNISNDPYYARDSGSMLKVDRRAILRGMRNAPPAVKAQTTIPCVPDEYLESFHCPRLVLPSLMSGAKGATEVYDLQPFRRKRPKGGSAQIAGQIPKKHGELLASAKDAYRVCLLEYALEAAPSLIPIPGMASKVVTYDRKESTPAAAQARKDATGTPDADTVFLAPEEVPPLHAGDLRPSDPPLLVLESHLFSAPCTRHEAASTDFLVIRRKEKMYVREIDSVLSVGVTEPKLEVMAPNSDRFKKFARDRVSLWLLREFLKNQKSQKGASIEREHLFGSFPRRRSFPETSLGKLLKELSKYHNSKYYLIPEPAKGFAAMEAEWLRTVSPEETCAFEAMESGWYQLINVGVQKLTHPTQANVRAAAEKTGLIAGPAVGAFIWSQLLRVPWYRSQIMIAAQRQQKKELIQALSSARIVNDLREGGSVMENRVASLTSAEAANVLVNQYRVQTRKIPPDLDDRKNMVYEMALKKSKGVDAVDYQEVIAGIIDKQRNIGSNRTAAGAGVTAAVAAGGVMVIPLEHQRDALENGVVDILPREEDRASPQEDPATAAKLAAGGEEVFGKSLARAGSGAKKIAVGGGKSSAGPSKSPGESSGNAAKGKSQRQLETEADEAELNKLKAKSSAVGVGAGGSGAKPKQGKMKRLKVTKKVLGADGKRKKEVVFVTDPEEIERLLASNEVKKKKSAAGTGKDTRNAGGDEGSASAGGSKLKIAIKVQKLTQGATKSKPVKARVNAAGLSRKRSGGVGEDDNATTTVPVAGLLSKKASSGSGAIGPGVEKVGQKGQVGKIKINGKKVREHQEAQAAKRKRAQYGDDLNYPARKVAKKSSTSRRKRNGGVTLNSILEGIETIVRATEGYIAESVPYISVARLRPGEVPPPGKTANNLAHPVGTSLDLTKSVDTRVTPAYKDVVKKQMYLDQIRYKCKQMKYLTAKDFLDDFALIARNARAFNSTPDVHWVVQHAQHLLDVASEFVEEKREELTAAEIQIKKERSESGKAKMAKSTPAAASRSSGAVQNNEEKADAVADGSPSKTDKAAVASPVASTSVNGNLPATPRESPSAPFPGGVFCDPDSSPLALTEMEDIPDATEIDPLFR
jgi:Protein of unknown function (DUF3591)/Bromodomain